MKAQLILPLILTLVFILVLLVAVYGFIGLLEIGSGGRNVQEMTAKNLAQAGLADAFQHLLKDQTYSATYTLEFPRGTVEVEIIQNQPASGYVTIYSLGQPLGSKIKKKLKQIIEVHSLEGLKIISTTEEVF